MFSRKIECKFSCILLVLLCMNNSAESDCADSVEMLHIIEVYTICYGPIWETICLTRLQQIVIP